MADKHWKAAERNLAAHIGGERVPITGRQRGATPDIAHDTLSLEVKAFAQYPKWLMDAWDQARAASKNGKPATVILHEKGKRYENDLVLMTVADLADLLQTLVPTEPAA